MRMFRDKIAISSFKLLLFMLLLGVLNVACNNLGKEKKVVSDIEVSTEVHNDVERIEPLNWWVGFKNQDIQLLVKDSVISRSKPEIKYPGVTISAVHNAKSPNYLFIDLHIDVQTQPGKFNILFKFENGKIKRQTYELKSRVKPSEAYIGFNSTDAIYLITPDRFSNGDASNDINETLLEKTIDRTNDYARHGGDIKGITNHLDYIEDLGFTAIWPCPLLTNNMSNSSYHGYAMTNFYEIDPRFGSLEEYLELSEKASKKGIKLIMDQVANHCGSEHWWMKDLPFSDWLNQQKTFENKENLKNSNHRRTTNQDLYASTRDKQDMIDGWFVASMPDLNQKNPFMATYIIQNSIWWIETAGLGGIRQDTYPYSDKDFMSKWAGAIMAEYPNFSIVGEEWSTNPLLIGYWQEGAKNRDGYDSNLKSPMDFAMQHQIVNALNEDESWENGLVKMYEGLANDFNYASPKNLLIFPDNHDMSRISTQLHEDVDKVKMALGYMFTLPRIPQFYYGTEILINDSINPGDHGLIRTDFPGGWDGDVVNAFSGEGLTSSQKDMQLYVKQLMNYRKHSKAIHGGKTIHFAPENGVYALFRVLEDEVVIVILNKSNEVSLQTVTFNELGLKGRQIKNIINEELSIWGDKITVNPNGISLFSTKIHN
ncbi:glycoside hydrolase family 13 protein [Mariniflexile sp. HNIBRBA6329]|uniref:glycoside hydrolase family 13 protein n=1 Tax=Mariniflexile sp. HNIBRBA6329 TaxID=3373088 RepID=UPI0037453D51